MKKRFLCFIAFLPLSALADPLLVTAKVLDRAQDGSAIRDLYVYPSVVLESGESASMHIGPELRFPVGSERVDLGDGVSKEETIYETLPVGLQFSLEFVEDDGVVTYRAQGTSSISLGTTGQISEIASKKVIFYGKTEIGGLVEAQLEGPDGTLEEIAFFFGPVPE
jgi:hypothetical protein